MIRHSIRNIHTNGKSQNILKSFKNPNLVKKKGFVDGKWTSSIGGETFDVLNPAFDDYEHALITSISSMGEADYENAIQKAEKSFQSFRKTTGRFRSELLLDMYKLMLENEEDLAKLIVLENGKPYADALGEVRYAASFFRWFSEEAPRITGDIVPSQVGTNKIFVMKQPIGVCGILTPWNFPAAMITRKLGASIAAGCTSVIKPASETPLSALALAYLAEKVGVPSGVINVLPSVETAKIGKLVCEHDSVRKVSFTGSTNVGKILMGQSASTLKKLSMELGGNAPFIVFEDADVDKAVQGAIASKFRSSGQTCVCANRLYVHESVYDEFASKLVSELKTKTKLGNGLDEGITHGPLIHERSMNKVTSHIEDAVTKGAEILIGGNKAPDLGENFHELTVLGNVTKDMLIINDETFGPIAPLIKFSSDEEVLDAANDTNVGLAGYFFSRSASKMFKIADNLNVGMIGFNTGAISEAAMPFGGVKQSGFGREGSKYGVDDYLVMKSLVVGDLE